MYDTTIYLNEGMQAGLDGLSVDRCPYLVGSRKGVLWIAGFVCAHAGPAVQRHTSSERAVAVADRARPIRHLVDRR